MADVPGKFFSATKVRTGVAPSSSGSIVGEPLPPVNPPGSSLNSVGLTMPSAFTVSNSPLTANGTIGVAGAGTVGQYIRGDGSLADFPQASGGGSSVSYYLNGSISQGTIGGVAYKELNKVPILGAGTDFTINANGYIASFLTDAGDPNLLEIPGGNWNFETYFSASSSGGSPSFYVELYKYDGTTFTLIASSSSSPELIAFGTNLNPYFSTLAVPTTVLTLTDRLAIRYYVTHSGRTITLHTENNHLCQVVTTFTTGLTSLNGLTAQVQNLAVGTSGTDFNIASATATHTFNLPTASATNRGALSSADWSLFNAKQNALTLTTTGTSGAATLVGATLNIPNYGSALSGYVPYTGATSNVDLGIYTLSSSNLIANGGFNSGALLLKQSNNAQGINLNYTTITPLGTTQLNFGFSQSSGVWKSFALNAINLTNNTNRTYVLPDADGTIALVGGAGVGTVTSVGLSSATSGVTIGSTPVTTSGTITLAIATASGSQNGLLSSTDWTTFNGKQNALTNPVTGTGVSGRVAYWNGTNSITSDADLLFDGSNLTVGGNVLVGSNQIIGINTADASDTGYLAICGASSDGPDRAGHIYLSGNERGTDAGSVVIAGGNTTSGTGATAAIVFRTLGTNKARLTSAGNFGLGTETPVTFGTRNLDVNGGAGSAYIVARGLNNAGTVEMAFDGAGYIGTKTAHDLIIRTSDLQRINIFATSGNVLVGSSGSDNGAKLQVSGTGTAATFETSAGINGIFNSTNASGGYIQFRRSGTSIGYLGNSAQLGIGTLNALELRADNNLYLTTTSGTLAMLSNGNVGVGTPSPASQATGATIGILDVSASSGGNLVLHRTGSSDTALFSILKASNGTYIDSTGAATAANNAIIFRVNNNNADQTTVNEAMRITSGGRVGIGQVSPDARLHVEVPAESPATGAVALVAKTSNGANDIFRWFDGATPLGVIKNNGNVLIGSTTDNGARLQTSGDSTQFAIFNSTNANGGAVTFRRNGTNVGHIGNSGVLGVGILDDLEVRSGIGKGLHLKTDGGRLTVSSAGNVLINETGVSPQGERFAVTATNLAAMFKTTGGAANNWAANFWNNATSGNNLFIEFGTETSYAGRGSVTYNRGSGVVAYNTTSDYRIKTEIQDFNAFDIINNLKPKEFKIRDAKQKSIGFIAHELQEFFPQAVHGEKDAIDSNNKPIYQGVDYSQLTGLLVKAIQELKQEIDTLKN